MLEISGLVKAYPGERAVLSGVDLTAGPGVTAVMGASGSGKSTLLRCVAGVQRPDAGSIVLDGGPVQWSARTSGDCRIGLVFQDYRLIDFLTVQENIRLARELRRLPRGAALESTLLEQVGLGGMGPRTTRTLSGGQQQRLAIARTLAARPRLILADEPTGALDRANSDVVARLLHDVAEQAQLPVLIATHDSVLAATAQQTYVFDDAGALHRAACAGSPA